jgi:integrase/recombinase XerC
LAAEKGNFRGRIFVFDNDPFQTQNPVRGVAMTEIQVVATSSKNTLISAVAQSQQDDIWDEFLRLQISNETKRTYAGAIDNFFMLIMGSRSSPQHISEFLRLSQYDAIAIVLKYKADLLDLNLAPSTINVRLSAIKSLVTHARKLGQCEFNLSDIRNVKVQTYRDTSGVKPEVFKSIIDGIDREVVEGEPERKSVMGKRDYAILRLLWDNALRRGEIGHLSIGDFQESKLWIKGKGRMQKESIDLPIKTVRALEEWLIVRGSNEKSDPLFISLDNRTKGMKLSTMSIDRLLKRATIKANVSKVMSPHKVRHSAITAALDGSNGDIRRVQKLSRHKNVATVMIYDDNRTNGQGDMSSMLSDLV